MPNVVVSSRLLFGQFDGGTSTDRKQGGDFNLAALSPSDIVVDAAPQQPGVVHSPESRREPYRGPRVLKPRAPAGPATPRSRPTPATPRTQAAPRVAAPRRRFGPPMPVRAGSAPLRPAPAPVRKAIPAPARPATGAVGARDFVQRPLSPLAASPQTHPNFGFAAPGKTLGALPSAPAATLAPTSPTASTGQRTPYAAASGSTGAAKPSGPVIGPHDFGRRPLSPLAASPQRDSRFSFAAPMKRMAPIDVPAARGGMARQMAAGHRQHAPKAMPGTPATSGSGPLSSPGALVRPNAMFTRENAMALRKAAADLGTDPRDLATAIAYETIGSFSPRRWGGKGGNYMGLIQFGPHERRVYGAHERQSFAEQVTGPVVRYMKDRGFKPGMGLLDLYSTINAGRPGRYRASDRPGATVYSHVEQMKRTLRPLADRFLSSAGSAGGASPAAVAGGSTPQTATPTTTAGK